MSILQTYVWCFSQWWFYLIPVAAFLFCYCYMTGRNPITCLLDYREGKRLEQAARDRLTWEQYKEKYHID